MMKLGHTMALPGVALIITAVHQRPDEAWGFVLLMGIALTMIGSAIVYRGNEI